MTEQLFILLEILLINIILSGDNAVVIAMASKSLPERQRKQAVWWGSCAAVVLRILLTFAAVYLLHIPYIQAVGSVLLLYIAIKLVTDDGGHGNVKEATSLAGAVSVILLADFVMSLDNVLAIAAVAAGNYWMIAIGIALSIPLIVWGSSLVMKLLTRFPLLIYAGAGVLGYTAGEMLVKEERIMRYADPAAHGLHWAVPVCGTLLVIGFGWFKNVRKGRQAADAQVVERTEAQTP
ncbi:YjbE family putative metal transport protein [Cohnella sp. CFH 77786]|uniref:TerC family protein n=1 Tax=Cohnella sp. CFH 77786 TaxID=2662265 RepID=UPI001C60C95F|nr:TerC family protein [Cohnella sp. CFH 77786]MBW5448073.1 YjbE family putative metal transport protein [Cohnella sp. CFH 77786]